MTNRKVTDPYTREKVYKTLLYSFCILWVSFSLSSCTIVKFIPVNVLYPAETKLGTDINRIDIHCKYCGNFTPEMEKDSLSRLQASVSLNFLHSFKENIQKSPIFDSTKIFLTQEDSLLTHLKKDKERLLQKNYLVVLDSIYIKDTVFTEKKGFLWPKLYTYASIDRFRCKIYRSSDFKIIDDYIQKDTLYWSVAIPDYRLEYYIIPSWNDVVWDAGIKAGEKFGHRIAPYWVVENRVLFFGSHRPLRRITDFMIKNQLDSAGVGFTNIMKTPVKNRKYYSKILHNYAVFLEMNDRFAEAIVAEEQSVKLKKNILSEHYIDILRKRKIDKIALDWQFSN